MKEKNAKENDNLEQEEGKAEKKAKKEKKEGGLPLPMIIGGAAGLVILIALSVILGTIIASNFFAPQQASVQAVENADKANDKSKKKIPADEDDPDAPADDDMHIFETGKITTNTKGASNIYVVLELAVDFKPYDPEDEKMKALVNEKGEINKELPLYNKLKMQVTSQITNVLASYTEPELQAARPELNNIMRTQLKSVFRKFELKLGDVHVVTFLVQQM